MVALQVEERNDKVLEQLRLKFNNRLLVVNINSVFEIRSCDMSETHVVIVQVQGSMQNYKWKIHLSFTKCS